MLLKRICIVAVLVRRGAGGTVGPDKGAIKEIYGEGATAADILSGNLAVPEAFKAVGVGLWAAMGSWRGRGGGGGVAHGERCKGSKLGRRWVVGDGATHAVMVLPHELHTTSTAAETRQAPCVSTCGIAAACCSCYAPPHNETSGCGTTPLTMHHRTNPPQAYTLLVQRFMASPKVAPPVAETPEGRKTREGKESAELVEEVLNALDFANTREGRPILASSAFNGKMVRGWLGAGGPVDDRCGAGPTCAAACFGRWQGPAGMAS